MSSKNNKKKRNSQQKKTTDKALYLPRLKQLVPYRTELERQFLIKESWNLFLCRIDFLLPIVTPKAIADGILYPSYIATFPNDQKVVAFDPNSDDDCCEKALQKKAIQDFCFYYGLTVIFFDQTDLHDGWSLKNHEVLYQHKDVVVSRKVILEIRQLFAKIDKISAKKIIRHLKITRAQFYACLFHHLLWIDICGKSVKDDYAEISKGMIFDLDSKLNPQEQKYSCGDNRVDVSDYHILINTKDNDEPDVEIDFFNTESAKYIT